MNLEEARKLACTLDYYDSSGGNAPGEAAELIREMAFAIEKYKEAFLIMKSAAAELTNYVEERPELHRIEREIEKAERIVRREC